MWNNLHLQCPAHDVCEYPLESKTTDWDEFTSILTSAADLLTSDDPLWTEGEVLNNIQQKLKRLLRCDKCLQLLQRVGQCLRNQVLLTLSESYLDLAERFHVALKNRSSLFMPSRQQLEYVLIRTQSAAVLLREAIQYSRETFCKLMQRLQIGHMIQDLVMALSVTSRLNIMFRAFLIQVCDVYQKVYSWQEKLIEGEWKWPAALDLPEDLEKWLNIEDSEKLNLSREQVDFLAAIFKKNEGSETNEECVTAESRDEESDCVIMDDAQVEDTTSCDYGEIVPRTEFQESQIKSNDVTQLQKLLLSKILKARSWKALNGIWNSIDDVSQNVLPQKLTLKKMRIIDNLLCKLKESLKEKRALDVTEKKKHIVSEVQKTALKFLKHLGYTKEQIAQYSNTLKQPMCNFSTANLTPVTDWSKLKKLYETLREILIACKQNKTCRKLEKAFKSKNADIKLLKQDNDNKTAKNMIFCTSKVLLAMCRKQIDFIKQKK